MTGAQLDATGRSVFGLDKGLRWWDPEIACTLVVTRPSADPDLWADYVRGARQSYYRHGVERALDMGALRRAENTALFFAAVDPAGKVMGGLRAKGPLESPDQCHAVVEWAGRPGLRAVRKMLTDRLPFGVVEMKTAWVTDDPRRNRALTRTLARTPFPTMALLNAQFVVATAGSHVLDRWRSSGGVVASKIPATPYPDERYRTRMMWWDRRTFANYADPEQVSRIFTEMARLNRELDQAQVVCEALGSGI